MWKETKRNVQRCKQNADPSPDADHSTSGTDRNPPRALPPLDGKGWAAPLHNCWRNQKDFNQLWSFGWTVAAALRGWRCGNENKVNHQTEHCSQIDGGRIQGKPNCQPMVTRSDSMGIWCNAGVYRRIGETGHQKKRRWFLWQVRLTICLTFLLSTWGQRAIQRLSRGIISKRKNCKTM